MKTQTNENSETPALKAYSIHFTGRRAGAIGAFYKIEASRFAHSPEEAIRLLYEPMPIAFEHIQQPDAKEEPSPFGWEQLYNTVQNERGDVESLAHHVNMILGIVARTARKCAKANAEWHDDERDENHGLYHADADAQYPAETQIEAAAELVLYYLRERPAGLRIVDKLQLAEPKASARAST